MLGKEYGSREEYFSMRLIVAAFGQARLTGVRYDTYVRAMRRGWTGAGDIVSTSATGQVLVDEDGTPLVGYTVVARHMSALFPSDLASGSTDGQGRFGLTYDGDFFVTEFGHRTIEFRVLDRVHRTVTSLKREDVEPGPLDLGVIRLKRADVTGWLVTLGKGTPTPSVSTGNAVGVLVDNVVAWKRVADVLKSARSSIELIQLAYDISGRSNPDPSKEDPAIVFQFAPPVPSVTAPRAVNASDDRPERLLLAAVGQTPAVDVRILLNRFVIDGHLIGAALLVPGLGLLILLVGGLALAFGAATSLDEVREYFQSTALPAKNIRGVATTVFAPTHAKLAIVDGTRAVSIASPFDQGYYGDGAHAIDDPRRGLSKAIPRHDVSFAVTGPVVSDMHDTYRLLWNVDADASDQIDAIPPPPPQTDLDGLDAFASLQVVRTLPSGRFTDPADGEKGVLEGYLRAIGNAQSFIYLENQYFTNDAIGTALLHALTDPQRPDLNAILLLNIDMDIPGYNRWQRKLIARIREGMVKAGLSGQQLRRFGVFTRWTHEAAAPPDRRNPRIVPIYLHSKIAVVDNLWATVGSANLDGASLDFSQFLHAIQFGDLRNSELNFLVLNGIEQQPPTTAVDLLRRRLWAEHLGLAGPTDPQLDTAPAGGWVELWRTQADAKLAGLKTNPGTVLPPAILPWPDVDETLNHPREHLAALLGEEQAALAVDPISGTRRFQFKLGTYRDKTAEVDPPPPEEGSI
jgi:phosphatidylserine/phosphatidylglycerophosphate/cardiolipin synthase-like enzyme